MGGEARGLQIRLPALECDDGVLQREEERVVASTQAQLRCDFGQQRVSQAVTLGSRE